MRVRYYLARMEPVLERAVEVARLRVHRYVVLLRLTERVECVVLVRPLDAGRRENRHALGLQRRQLCVRLNIRNRCDSLQKVLLKAILPPLR